MSACGRLSIIVAEHSDVRLGGAMSAGLTMDSVFALDRDRHSFRSQPLLHAEHWIVRPLSLALHYSELFIAPGLTI